ncbi:MAG: hypothetical protein GXO27_03895 [Chlorobi bacterium]|nr:hypothetical protein [Chlorobiota bacterium]
MPPIGGAPLSERFLWRINTEVGGMLSKKFFFTWAAVVIVTGALYGVWRERPLRFVPPDFSVARTPDKNEEKDVGPLSLRAPVWEGCTRADPEKGRKCTRAKIKAFFERFLNEKELPELAFSGPRASMLTLRINREGWVDSAVIWGASPEMKKIWAEGISRMPRWEPAIDSAGRPQPLVMNIPVMLVPVAD